MCLENQSLLDQSLLFNIYLYDLFFFLKDVGICNFVDDTTTCIFNESLANVLKSFEKNSMLAIRWFENNYMKLNTDKCHLIVSSCKYKEAWRNIGKELIWKSNNVKRLGITTDRDLKFDKNVLKLYRKANQKLNALSGMANWLSFNKRRVLFKAFVESQLSIVRLFACLIVDVPTTKLIDYMKEPLELFMKMTFQLLINYLIWINLSVFTTKIPRDS